MTTTPPPSATAPDAASGQEDVLLQSKTGQSGKIKPQNPNSVLELRSVFRFYKQGDSRLEVLRGVRMSIRRGEIAALIGPSGSGKSSLLHVAGLLEKPTAGQVMIGGRDCVNLSDREKTEIRRSSIGFVYQFHQLLPEFTALENVVLPQLIAGRKKRRAEQEARRLLVQMGLGWRLTHRPSELSGGEQQRVAVARALANEPDILLADEPTGNLDPDTSNDVFGQMLEQVRQEGRAALIATHNIELARRMDRIFVLKEGKLYERRFKTPAQAPQQAPAGQAPRVQITSAAPKPAGTPPAAPKA